MGSAEEERKEIDASVASARKPVEAKRRATIGREAKEKSAAREERPSEEFLLDDGTKLRSEPHFSNRPNDAVRKTRGASVSSKEFNARARLRRVPPRRKPCDLYRALYENRVASLCGVFYCFFCEDIFDDWFEARSHATASSHSTFSVARHASSNTCRGVAEGYKFLVRNAIFASDSGQKLCKLCQCRIAAGATNVADHAAGSRHAGARREFAKLLTERRKRVLIGRNAIKIVGKGEYWCAVCARGIDHFDRVKAHVMEKSHKAKNVDRQIASERESSRRDGVAEIEEMDGVAAIKKIDGVAAVKRMDGVAAVKKMDGVAATKLMDGVEAIKPMDGVAAMKKMDGVVAIKKMDGVAAVKKMDDVAAVKKMDGVAATRLMDGVEATKPMDGVAAIKKMDGVAATKPMDGVAAIKKMDGVAAIKKMDGVAATKLMDGVAATKLMDGVVAIKPMDGVVAIKPMDGAAATKPMDGVAAIKSLGGVAAIKPLDGVAATKPMDGVAAIKPSRGAAAIKSVGGAAAIKPSRGAAAIKPHGGVAATKPMDGVAAIRPLSGVAATKPMDGAAAIKLSRGVAAIKPHGGVAAIKLHGGVAAIKPHGGVAAIKPHGGVAAIKPHGGVAAIKLHGGVAAIKPMDGVAAIKPLSGVAAIKPTRGAAVIKPHGGVAAIKPHGGVAAIKPHGGVAANKPHGGVAAIKPSGSAAEIKPHDGTAATKPPGGVAAIKPHGGVAAIKPHGGVAAIKLHGGVAAIKPHSGVAAIKPHGGVAAIKPSGSAAEIKPHDGTAATKPPGGVAAIKPHDGTAANKPPGGAAAIKPPDGVAAIKPPNGVTATKPHDVTAATVPPGGVAAIKPPDDATGAIKITEKSATEHANGEDNKSSAWLDDCVFRTSSSYAICDLCNCTIKGGERNINEHLAGSDHTAASRKYRLDLIDRLSSKKRDYYCNACDCPISGIDNLWRHTWGTRHVTSVASLDKKSSSTNETKSATGYRASSAKSKIPKSKTTVRPYSADKRTQCDVCGQKFPHQLALHAHMAGHFSRKFMSAVALPQDGIFHGDAVDEIVKNAPSALDRLSTTLDDLEKEPEERPKGVSQFGNFMDPKRLRRIVGILSFENNEIYNTKEKLRELKLATRLSYEATTAASERKKKNGRIYCLVCLVLTDCTVNDYHEHVASLDHTVELELMEREDARFAKFPEQYSALELAKEYMSSDANGTIHCHACDIFVNDLDAELRAHVEAQGHAQARDALRDLGSALYDRILTTSSSSSSLSFDTCDWYKVQLYSCVPCRATYRHEVNFCKHLACASHVECVKKRPENSSRRLVFDFCNTCALLWYGYRRTRVYHRLVGSHLVLERDGHYKSRQLSLETRRLLREPEIHVDEFFKRRELDEARERDKEATIVRDIEIAVRDVFPSAEAHLFGSRVTGLGSFNCDVDVFLDCGNMYSGSKSSRGEMLRLIEAVAKRLENFSDRWMIEELLTACRSPIIRAHHKVTQLDCDISFENGLAVENTKLIRSYNERYPLCRRMIIFLKRWATLCDLTGTGRITSYALYWHVIFYLQQETILPSVAELIEKHNASRKIDGWEVGVSRDFTRNVTSNEPSLRQLLAGFFRFWTNFDHRRDVACPLIGRALKKLSFLDCDELPAPMRPYIDYMGKSNERKISEPFRVDSEMCIQDPFDLQHNLTKAVRKVYLKRFREYCALSYELIVAS